MFITYNVNTEISTKTSTRCYTSEKKLRLPVVIVPWLHHKTQMVFKYFYANLASPFHSYFKTKTYVASENRALELQIQRVRKRLYFEWAEYLLHDWLRFLFKSLHKTRGCLAKLIKSVPNIKIFKTPLILCISATKPPINILFHRRR